METKGKTWFQPFWFFLLLTCSLHFWEPRLFGLVRELREGQHILPNVGVAIIAFPIVRLRVWKWKRIHVQNSTAGCRKGNFQGSEGVCAWCWSKHLPEQELFIYSRLQSWYKDRYIQGKALTCRTTVWWPGNSLDIYWLLFGLRLII